MVVKVLPFILDLILDWWFGWGWLNSECYFLVQKLCVCLHMFIDMYHRDKLIYIFMLLSEGWKKKNTNIAFMALKLESCSISSQMKALTVKVQSGFFFFFFSFHGSQYCLVLRFTGTKAQHSRWGLPISLWLKRFLRQCRFSRAQHLHCLLPGMMMWMVWRFCMLTVQGIWAIMLCGHTGL